MSRTVSMLLLSALLSAGTALAQVTPVVNAPVSTASPGTQVPAATAPGAATATTSVPGIPVPQVAPPVTTVTESAPPVVDATLTESQLTADRVFGQWLFQGRFAAQSFRGFNPDYLVSVGDLIDLRLWGAYTFEARLEVDAQGNIFVPQVGPVAVANTRNSELNNRVTARVKETYRENVGVYATLAGALPVKVFVSGNVVSPGLYGAYASDSLLHFLDRAGGIDPRAGSYLDVRVLRAGREVQRVNLYEFLLAGKLPLIQFRDGDTVFVGPRRSSALVTGLVSTPAQFEFDAAPTLGVLLRMAGIDERATHVRLVRSRGPARTAQYLQLGEAAAALAVEPGDEIEVVADRLIGEIVVTIEGEHRGSGQYVLPYEATLQDLIDRLQFSDQSLRDSLQLYRRSIAERQKQMLDEMLRKLEAAVLTARSATHEEAQLRVQEAQLILQFVERARKIEPRGQLVLPEDTDAARVALEDGDVIRIPRAANSIAVHGEVMFPNSFAWESGRRADDYIEMAGGMTGNGNGDKVLILKPNGQILSYRSSSLFQDGMVEAGDEVLVMPKVDTKRFQFTKDIVEVLYQIAVAAGVVVRL